MTKEKYPLEEWTPLSGDVNWVDYGGSWLVTAWDDLVWIIRFENMAEWGDGAEGFHCEILLAKLSSDAVEDALKSCGWEFDEEEDIVCPHNGELIAEHGYDEKPSKAWVSCVADCLMGYGAVAHLHSISETCSEEDDDYEEKAEKLLEMAYVELLNLQCSYGKTDDILNSPANKLGATWEDIMDGDALALLRRKAEDVICGKSVELSTEESIVLKMYGACGGQTLGGKVETELAVAHYMLEDEDEPAS